MTTNQPNPFKQPVPPGSPRQPASESAPRHLILRILLDRLARLTGLSADEVQRQLRPPPDPALGDYALACFALAKERKLAPQALAAQWAAELSGDPQLDPVFSAVQAAGPFLNFRARPGIYCEALLGPILQAGAAFGHSQEGAGRKIVIDYSSPNIAKPFHIGHLMSTILGASLVRIFRAQGYEVIGVNHLGDWGTQCGYQFLAWQRADEGRREEELAKRGLDYLVDLYVGINEPAKRLDGLRRQLEQLPAGATPAERAQLGEQVRVLEAEVGEIERQARALFKELEAGDPGLRALWTRLRRKTLEVLQLSYDRLGVSFESDAGEAFYEPYMQPMIEDLKARGVLVPSEGAWVIPLEEPGAKKKRPPFIIIKSDGATKYDTRDLAAAIYRQNQYHFAQNLYVTDVRQSEHFSGLFLALAKAGHAWAGNCHHVSYGIMKIREGDATLPMTTRGGRMIPLGELLDRMVAIVRGIIEEKNPELDGPRKAAVAEAVGLGAIVFWVQSRRRNSNIVFDWKLATNPDGDTGPYVQYTHARVCSILRKAASASAESPGEPAAPGVSGAVRTPGLDELLAALGKDPDPAGGLLRLLQEPEEVAVVKALDRFPERVGEAAREYEPSVLATWLIETARTFNDFYNKHQVLKSEPALRTARLALVYATRQILAEGLRLLGMTAPEEM